MDHRPGNHSAGLWHFWLNRALCLFSSTFSADASALPRCGDLLEASVFAQPRRRVFVLSLAPISALNRQATSKYAYLQLVTELLTFVHQSKL